MSGGVRVASATALMLRFGFGMVGVARYICAATASSFCFATVCYGTKQVRSNSGG